MKKMYILLLGLVCSAVVIAQTTEWTDVPAEDIIIEDSTMTEDLLAEESDQAVITDELLAEIQQDCQFLAQQENIDEGEVDIFVAACVADNVEMEQAASQGSLPEVEVVDEEYVEEVLVEEESVVVAE